MRTVAPKARREFPAWNSRRAVMSLGIDEWWLGNACAWFAVFIDIAHA